MGLGRPSQRATGLSTRVSYEMPVSGSPPEHTDALVLAWPGEGLTCSRERTGFRDGRRFREIVEARTVFIEPASIVEKEAAEMVRNNEALSPRIAWCLFWDAFVVAAFEREDEGWLERAFPREAPGWLRAERDTREESARKVLES